MKTIPNLKTARKAAGYTQPQAAGAMDVALGTYRNWEQGISNPSIDTLVAIADLLDVSIDYLTGRVPLPQMHVRSKQIDVGDVTVERLPATGTLEAIDVAIAYLKFAAAIIDEKGDPR